jgi:hypothetical protein
MLRLDLPFGYEGRVWLAPVAVLRMDVEGGRPLYFHLPDLDVVTAPDLVGLRVPPDVAEDAHDALSGRRADTFVARIEWFLDGFAAGGDTPETVRKDMERPE